KRARLLIARSLTPFIITVATQKEKKPSRKQLAREREQGGREGTDTSSQRSTTRPTNPATSATALPIAPTLATPAVATVEVAGRSPGVVGVVPLSVGTGVGDGDGTTVMEVGTMTVVGGSGVDV